LIRIAVVVQPADDEVPVANSPWGETPPQAVIQNITVNIKDSVVQGDVGSAAADAPSQPQVTNQPPQPQPQVTKQPSQPQPQVTKQPSQPQPQVTKQSPQPQPQVTNQPSQPQPQVMYQPPQPQPQVMGSVNPQPMMMGSVNPQMVQSSSPFNIPVQYAQSYKKIHANDWFIMGIVSCFVGPFIGLCWIISLVGVISMATKLNIENTAPGHPEADKVKSALIVNIIALIIPIVVMFVMIGIF